ncbi:MAG: ATP-grasp domain-containing protein [Candidatus Zixiibacteriota bacterium]
MITNSSLSVQPLNVLVTDGSYKHALGIVRTLGRRGHRVYVTGSSRFSPAFFSRFTQDSATCPEPRHSPDAYAECLRTCAIRWNIDLVIPVGYASVETCAVHADEFRSRGAFTLIPTPNQFELASDKWQMIETARSQGLSVPNSCLPSSLDEARHFLHEQPSGCVVKHRRESLGKGSTRINDDRELEVFFERLGANSFGTAILQTFVDGHGSGYMALSEDGRIVREFAHRRLREMPATGGYATAAESIRDNALMEQGRRLFETLEWNGPGMVEFRVDGDRRWFIEFNPKFWGSLDLALQCGADFPGDLCLLATGVDLSERPVPEYRIGYRAWWPWRGDVRRLWQRPGDVVRLLADAFSPSARSNWRWTDVIPNLIEVGGELTYGLREKRDTR